MLRCRTSGHSSWHHGEEADDHALTDWWYLAQARTIHQVDLRCRGRTAHSCQFNRKKMSPEARSSAAATTPGWPLPRVLVLARGAPAVRGYSNAGLHVR